MPALLRSALSSISRGLDAVGQERTRLLNIIITRQSLLNNRVPTPDRFYPVAVEYKAHRVPTPDRLYPVAVEYKAHRVLKFR